MEPIELGQRLGRWSSGRGPLYGLLAAGLRRLVDDGDLAPGEPLPPDRTLAAALTVGRSTVVAAYDLLAAEGRIVRRQGSGTRVAGPATAGATGPAAAPAPTGTTGAPVFLHLLEPLDDTIMLACAAPGAPPPELIDAYAEVVPQLAGITGDIGYHPAGLAVLRQAVADRHTDRGTPTSAEQILITNGGQQALSLLARVFVAPGDVVLVEAPTYPGALETFHEHAGLLQTLPVGLPGFEAAIRARRPALAYVVPSFHNPTGSVLTALQRRSLAAAAARGDVPLIEDEITTDLGFPGTDVPRAGPDSVMSIGSLSKVVWGGLRVGWIRAPAPVIAKLARLRAVQDLGGNLPAQLAATALLPQLETLGSHLGAELQSRHDLLRAELARLVPEWDAPAVTAGQTLWVRLPHGDGASFAQAALRAGVAVLPGGGLDASGGSRDHLRLHFVASPAQLTEAVRRLAAAWTGYDPPDRQAGSPPAMAV